MSMRPFPHGCGGCNGSCCLDCAEGVAPWRGFEYPALLTKLGSDGAKELARATEIQTKDTGKGRCDHLMEDGRCSIEVKFGYDAKPFVCREEYVVGKKLCLEARKHYDISRDH